jgi:DNA repair protein RadC
VARYRTIKDWPEEDRPREKLIEKGPESLTEAELVAIILRTGNGRSGDTAVDQAHLLLNKFGGLRGLEGGSFAELSAVPGIGDAKVAQLQACFEIARRLGRDKWTAGTRLRSAEDVFRDFASRLEGKKRELFFVVLLTNKNEKIREVKISEGSLTASLVHPREVYHPVIRESAAAVLFVHNHPSGDPSPSPEDVEITRRLKEVGDVMGIRVLDHVVIGRGRYFSFSDRGLL